MTRPTTSQDTLQKLQALVKSLPLQSPIFLPTERVDLEEALEGLSRVKALYDWRLDVLHRPRLRSLKQKYAGRTRCFVIGNGPSLNQTDLSLLRNEVTFAVNGFFLKAEELAWRPTFYVVEDHLVAEDRAEQINELTGSIKLFPASLAYCLEETSETIFFDHRPRPGFPNGFDFSTRADEVTYTGCTVTFTCLQLAASLGFKHIYLIGVDADYSMPKDLERSGSYGTEVLDMRSDDPNHFDPNYFGKGFRWHDPQVDKMFEAYREAKRRADQVGIEIYNAGIGGKLEIFPRVEYQSLFPSPSAIPEPPGAELPKVVIIDLTVSGNGTATGEYKANLFARWPDSRLLHVFVSGNSTIGARFCSSSGIEIRDSLSSSDCIELIERFAPDSVFYRPVPESEELHSLAMYYIQRHPNPVVLCILDDWLERLRYESDSRYLQLKQDLSWLVERSSKRIVVSDQMAAEYAFRYGKEFETVANGVNPVDWPLTTRRDDDMFVVRYAGALAKNMSYHSVLRVAKAVERLSKKGLRIRFEINTRRLWADLIKNDVSGLASCSVTCQTLDAARYRKFLQGADVLLIAYNFDEKSRIYTRYSLANKLPECLVSGRPVLVHGPSDIATVQTVRRVLPNCVIDSESSEVIQSWLEDLLTSPDRYDDLARKARQMAETGFSLEDRQQRLEAIFDAAVRAPYRGWIRYHFSNDAAHIDEAALIAELLSDRSGNTFVMLDVGAHHGSALRDFALRDWTVIAFEPDSVNRSALESGWDSFSNVRIDDRAVADVSSTGKPFFSSPVSSGISGLLRFHDSHTAQEQVDVTTINDIIDEYDLAKVDFLKIDVEGFDFAVIKGIPWDRIRPSVIVCEFEDAKTVLLGHKWPDIADFLVERGYVVYVSEWYPIERYGVRHKWRGLRRYPCDLCDSSGWGNLLAFSDVPPVDVLAGAADVVATSASDVRKLDSAGKSGSSELQQTVPYARLAERIRNKSETLFRFGQFVLWLMRSAKARPVLLLLLVGLPAASMIGMLLADSDELWRFAAISAFVSGSLVFLGKATYSYVKVKLRGGTEP